MRFSPACLSLAIVVSFGAGATAQSGSNSSVPKPPTTYQTPHDSRDQLPQVGGSIYMMGQPTKVTILPAPTPGKIAMLAPPSNHVCYAMRSYYFVQDGPSPDTVRLKDSTTCEPAASGRMKSATAQR